jgi:hypothetical protein
MKRGDMEEFYRDDKLVGVQWKDPKAVSLTSVGTSCQLVENVRRWSKTGCIVHRCMGGVEICDQLMEAYRTFLKTKKWILKVILHFTDLASLNAWLEY